MKRGFTLMELLIVIAIMALMGSLTVAGYKQMKRGMQERSVMDNVNQFVRAAYQRAQIDRQNVVVYFWNETIRNETADSFAVVVGKAIAVRQHGRVTFTESDFICDEFGDLEFKNVAFASPTESEEQSSSTSSSAGKKKGGLRLYKVGGSDENRPDWSIVAEETQLRDGEGVNEDMLLSGTQKLIRLYGFREVDDTQSSGWKVGDAYGFECGAITLPEGYTFGKNYSTSTSEPIDSQSYQVMLFKPGTPGSNSGSGKDTIEIFNLRPGKGGQLTAKSIGTTQKPTESLE